MPNTPGTPLDQWSLIVATLLPLLISAVTQRRWSHLVKVAVAIGTCLIAALVQLSLQQALDPTNVVNSTLALASLSISFYHSFWKKTGVIQAIEEATEIGGKANE